MPMVLLDDLAKSKGYDFNERVKLQEYAAVQTDVFKKVSFTGKVSIEESDFVRIVQGYHNFLEESRFLEEEAARIDMVARTMPITSSGNFEGYRIVRYGGYVSGDEVATVSRGLFGTAMREDGINNAIKSVRTIAIDELKHEAAEIGCNAVISLDFDYITIEKNTGDVSNGDVFVILTANGTAVEIEKID